MRGYQGLGLSNRAEGRGGIAGNGSGSGGIAAAVTVGSVTAVSCTGGEGDSTSFMTGRGCFVAAFFGLILFAFGGAGRATGLGGFGRSGTAVGRSRGRRAGACAWGWMTTSKREGNSGGLCDSRCNHQPLIPACNKTETVTA